MQTILAYRFTSPSPAERIVEAVGRVVTHYQRSARRPLEVRAVIGGTVGLVAMVPRDETVAWPAWSRIDRRVVATAYVPLGWRSVIDGPIGTAPHRLLDALVRNPDLVSELPPPFALLELDQRTQSIRVLNDGLGYARIYASETPDENIVVATRAGAIPIFLGRAPHTSVQGWSALAGAGWFMGDSTPIDGIQHLGPGTMIHADTSGIDHSSVDALKAWTAHRESMASEQIGVVAGDLERYADDVGALWKSRPTVHLSGGRDSRAAAAGFVARGVPAKFHTVATLSGELDVARRLLERVGRTADHGIVEERDNAATGDIRTRAAALHLAYDGIYGPAGLKQGLFRGFDDRPPVVTGAAGEIARGNFYKGKFLDAIRRGGDEGPTDRLDRLYAFHGGVPTEVRETVRRRITEVLAHGRARGVRDVSILDYFYLAERLRRWSNASTRIGTLTPLASPAYVRAAFDQSPEAKLEERLHLGIINRLVPAWADVPFYKASPGDTARMTRPRMWNSGDRAAIENILAEPESWADVFDVADVQAIWGEALSEGGSRHEMLIQRVVWRATYEAHIKVLTEAAKSVGGPLDAQVEGQWLILGPTEGPA